MERIILKWIKDYEKVFNNTHLIYSAEGKIKKWINDVGVETVFIDKFGKHWDEDSLNELIETLQSLNTALDRISYYKN